MLHCAFIHSYIHTEIRIVILSTALAHCHCCSDWDWDCPVHHSLYHYYTSTFIKYDAAHFLFFLSYNYNIRLRFTFYILSCIKISHITGQVLETLKGFQLRTRGKTENPVTWTDWRTNWQRHRPHKDKEFLNSWLLVSSSYIFIRTHDFHPYNRIHQSYVHLHIIFRSLYSSEYVD
jgi:hypothetical protein